MFPFQLVTNTLFLKKAYSKYEHKIYKESQNYNYTIIHKNNNKKEDYKQVTKLN